MHTIVVDLGYGDAGKGTVVDRLCVPRPDAAPVTAVIRFNGGAQAAHNVVTTDGRHHTFAQFGSGTFSGVPTHLSRLMLVDPLALATEARHLASLGVPDPLALLTVDRRARLTTPYHAAANRARERARGTARHGSCGMGIGETAAYALAHPADAPTAGDCTSRTALRRKLTLLRDRLTAAVGPLDAPPVDACLDAFTAFADHVTLVDETHLPGLLRRGPAVFEGAQGVLLDEGHGFHPYTTWSTTTFDGAETLLAEAGRPHTALRLGVVRTYTTRHGPGPLVTEDPALAAALPEPHNGHGRWQGAFRAGHFDVPAHPYALAACGGVDALAVTHLDAPARHRALRLAHGYRTPDGPMDHIPAARPGDLRHQQAHPTPVDRPPGRLAVARQRPARLDRRPLRRLVRPGPPGVLRTDGGGQGRAAGRAAAGPGRPAAGSPAGRRRAVSAGRATAGRPGSRSRCPETSPA